mgnify:CR=1 FL=1
MIFCTKTLAWQKSNVMRQMLTLFVVCTFPLTTSAQSSDWPHWGGPNANFKIDGANFIQPDNEYALRVVWKKPLGAGYSSVSVANGIAVTMFSDGSSDYVVAFDSLDGSTKWRHTIGEGYLGHWGSQNGPLSTPLITETAVIALSPRAPDLPP